MPLMPRSPVFAALLLALLASLPEAASGQSRSIVVLGSPSPPLEQALRLELQARGLRMVTPLPLGPLEPVGPDPEERSVTEAEGALDRARKLYYDVQPARAAGLLEAELRARGAALARARRYDLLAKLRLWHAVCLLKQSETAAARTALASAILLGHGPPDGARFPPSVAKAFESVRRQLAVEPRARVEVELEPADAQVWVDGQPLAAGAELAPGEHWLLAESPGHLATARPVQLDSGRTTRLKLTLYPADRSVLRRQLQTLASRGELDPRSPRIAHALCRWRGVRQALLVDEGPTELTLTRLDCEHGQTTGRFREKLTRAPTELVVQRALSQLWSPGERVPTRSPGPTTSRPFYKRWWFWTLVGAAAAGATAAGVVLGTRGPGTYTLRPGL